MAMTLLSAISLRAESGGSFRPGDTVILEFSMKHDDLDGPYTVNRQGEIRLPFVGSMAVAGPDRKRLARAHRGEVPRGEDLQPVGSRRDAVVRPFYYDSESRCAGNDPGSAILSAGPREASGRFLHSPGKAEFLRNRFSGEGRGIVPRRASQGLALCGGCSAQYRLHSLPRNVTLCR